MAYKELTFAESMAARAAEVQKIAKETLRQRKLGHYRASPVIKILRDKRKEASDPLAVSIETRLASFKTQKAATKLNIKLPCSGEKSRLLSSFYFSKLPPPTSSALDSWAHLERMPLSSVATPETIIARNQAKQSLTAALLHLPPREERVIRLRFGIGCKIHTLEEVGRQFSLEKESVRQIEGRALIKMRSTMRRKKVIAECYESLVA